MSSPMPTPLPTTVPVTTPPLSPVPDTMAEGSRLVAVAIRLDELHAIVTRDFVTAHRVEKGVLPGAMLRGLFVEGANIGNEINRVRIHLVFEHARYAPVALGAMIPEQQLLLQEYMPALTEMRQLVRAMVTRPTG